MPSRRIILLVLALFVVTLAIRLPARWVAGLLPGDVECSAATGTVWNGQCASLRAGALQLADIGWRLHPLLLLRGALVADLRSADPRADGRVQLWLRSGQIMELRDVQARVQLASDLIPALNNYRGQVELTLPQFVLQAMKPRALTGTARVLGLEQIRPALEFGNYELRFAESGTDSSDIIGALRDLQGPMAVNGQLRVRPSGEYEVEGTVAGRPTASAELLRLIEFLGPADAQGARAFSLAGTL